MEFFGAKWIYNNKYTSDANQCVYFYKDFKITSEVKSAVLYVASTDSFRFFLNSQRVNTNYFENRSSAFLKKIPAYKFDIKDKITDNNSVCVIVSAGRKKYRADEVLLYSVISIEYEDGTVERIVSDSGWDVSFGPLLTSSIHGGEKTDFTKGMAARSKAFEYNDTKGYTYLLSESRLPKLLTDGKLKCEMIQKDSVKVFDLGISAACVFSGKFKGKKGDKVTLRYSDTLEFNDKSCDEIILSGGEDCYVNEFVFRKFRYAEITADDVFDVEFTELSYNLSRSGDFYCSNSKLNEAYVENVSARKNMFADYKMLTDDYSVSSFEFFSFDCRGYIESILDIFRSTQAENGCIPVISGKGTLRRYGVFANAAFNPIFLLYRHFIMFGDAAVLKKNFDMCERILDFVDGYCDSEDIEFALKTLYAVKLMEKFCGFLGYAEENHYKKLYQSLKSSLTDSIDVNELSADLLAMLYEYGIYSAAELKDTAVKHSYKEVSERHVSDWLSLLYESGKFEEPYKIITSDDFDKRLCGEWLYSGCLGIKPDESKDGAGFKKVIIQPAIDLSYTLKKASGGYLTPYGKISVFWEKTDDMYTCCVTVPYEIDATCRFNGFKVVNQKSSRETYVFLLRRN